MQRRIIAIVNQNHVCVPVWESGQQSGAGLAKPESRPPGDAFGCRLLRLMNHFEALGLVASLANTECSILGATLGCVKGIFHLCEDARRRLQQTNALVGRRNEFLSGTHRHTCPMAISRGVSATAAALSRRHLRVRPETLLPPDIRMEANICITVR